MINVYYSTLDNGPIEDFEPLQKHMGTLSESDSYKNFLRCPAFVSSMQNTFIVKSSFDYEIEWKNGRLSSTMYDQSFFDDSIFVRDQFGKMVTYKNPKLVLFSDKPLIAQNLPPYYHNNSIKKNFVLTGKYDIGKHYRPLELALLMLQEKLIIKQYDALYYVKFETEEKLNFVPYFHDEYLDKLMLKAQLKRAHSLKLKPLSYWYESNYIKSILKRIKQNILEK